MIDIMKLEDGKTYQKSMMSVVEYLARTNIAQAVVCC